MENKKIYQAPKVKRVRLDIKSSVMGYCATSPDMIFASTCDTPGIPCAEPPL